MHLITNFWEIIHKQNLKLQFRKASTVHSHVGGSVSSVVMIIKILVAIYVNFIVMPFSV